MRCFGVRGRVFLFLLKNRLPQCRKDDIEESGAYVADMKMNRCTTLRWSGINNVLGD